MRKVSHLGIPDAGIATYTDMLARVSKVVEKSSAPVIAGDTITVAELNQRFAEMLGDAEADVTTGDGAVRSFSTDMPVSGMTWLEPCCRFQSTGNS